MLGSSKAVHPLSGMYISLLHLNT